MNTRIIVDTLCGNLPLYGDRDGMQTMAAGLHGRVAVAKKIGPLAGNSMVKLFKGAKGLKWAGIAVVRMKDRGCHEIIMITESFREFGVVGFRRK